MWKQEQERECEGKGWERRGEGWGLKDIVGEETGRERMIVIRRAGSRGSGAEGGEGDEAGKAAGEGARGKKKGAREGVI